MMLTQRFWRWIGIDATAPSSRPLAWYEKKRSRPSGPPLSLQTLPEEPEPQWPAPDSPFFNSDYRRPIRWDGDFDAAILDRLIETVSAPTRRERIEVRQVALNDYSEGACVPGACQIGIGYHGDVHLFEEDFVGPSSDGMDWRVILNNRRPPVERFVTLAHELAHIYLGHLGASTKTRDPWPDRRELAASTKEAESDWVAELIGRACALNMIVTARGLIESDQQKAARLSDDAIRHELVLDAAVRVASDAGLAGVDGDLLFELMGVDGCQSASVELPDAAHVRDLMGKALSTPTPDAIMAFLSFAKRLRSLAPYNLYMVYAQRPGAVAVATREEWEKVGQSVVPDAIPILILRTYGPITRVFELADTVPKRERDPREDMFAAAGSFDPVQLAKLKAGLRDPKRKLHIAVEEEDFGALLAGKITASGLFGASGPGESTPTIGSMAHGNHGIERVGRPTLAWRIKLNRRMSPAEQYATLAHELGHLFCGHLGGFEANNPRQDEYGWPDRREIDLHTKEIEAELVAWLICERAGLVSGAPLYIKSHMKRAGIREGVGAVDLDIVIRALARIEKHGGGRSKRRGN